MGALKAVYNYNIRTLGEMQQTGEYFQKLQRKAQEAIYKREKKWYTGMVYSGVFCDNRHKRTF